MTTCLLFIKQKLKSTQQSTRKNNPGSKTKTNKTTKKSPERFGKRLYISGAVSQAKRRNR
jgi:hypothetical protein